MMIKHSVDTESDSPETQANSKVRQRCTHLILETSSRQTRQYSLAIPYRVNARL